MGLGIFPGFDCNIQPQIVQNHKQVKDFPSGMYFLPDVCHTFRARLGHICSSTVQLLSVFVSQLYFSCKVMQLQLASIWQGFFFCLSPVLESYIHRANQFKR